VTVDGRRVAWKQRTVSFPIGYGRRVLRATTTRPRSHVAIAAIVGLVLLVVLAKVAARFYYDPTLWVLAGWWVPPDSGIFIEAGGKILAGESPYLDVNSIGDDVGASYGYVYPPLLAIVISPLSLLSGPTAAMLFSVVLVACIVGALWLLGVTDWRCYLVALLWPFNRVALDWGRIDPLLVLLIAATWRLRDRPWSAATSTGAAVATKLFLWPTMLWLLVTGRRRAAGLSVVMTVALILLPWAAIGFVDLLQYPALLRDVSRQEYDSFSVTALVHALGGDGRLAKAIVVAIGAALIALSVRTARNVDWTRRERDRRSLTLILAAALVLSPVVWSNYFVLLLVPLALAYPTLSAPWLVVLAASLFDLFHDVHPENRLQLVVVVVFVTAVFVAAYRPDRPRFLGNKPAGRRGSREYDTANPSTPVAGRPVS
jgi:alpha-1,2-mannosyltransferase